MKGFKRFDTGYQILEFGDSAIFFTSRVARMPGMQLLRSIASDEESLFAEGKIETDSIISFSQDKGIRVFKPPRIVISFYDPCSLTEPRLKKYQSFSFGAYYFRPPKDFNKLVDELRRRGIREL